MEDPYYRKYLKYKAKYMNLKQDGGLITTKSGNYTYFVNEEDLTTSHTPGTDAPSVGELNAMLNGKGVYRIQDGSKKLELIYDAVALNKARLAVIGNTVADGAVTANKYANVASVHASNMAKNAGQNLAIASIQAANIAKQAKETAQVVAGHIDKVKKSAATGMQVYNDIKKSIHGGDNKYREEANRHNEISSAILAALDKMPKEIVVATPYNGSSDMNKLIATLINAHRDVAKMKPVNKFVTVKIVPLGKNKWLTSGKL